MSTTPKITKTLNWPKLIKQYRLSLDLSRTQFGERFNVSRVAVYYWESGQAEAPYAVTWEVLQYLKSQGAV